MKEIKELEELIETEKLCGKELERKIELENKLPNFEFSNDHLNRAKLRSRLYEEHHDYFAARTYRV